MSFDFNNISELGFSQSVCVDNIIYTHGQLGSSKKDFTGQADQSLDLLLEELQVHGATLKDIFKVTIYLTNKVNLKEEYFDWFKRRFEGHTPIRTTLVVEGLSPNPNSMVKIELVAKKP